MSKPETSQPTGIREYTFCIDVADRSLKTCENPEDVVQSAAQDIRQQLVGLGLQPTALSSILFVATVDPMRQEDDWTLCNEIHQLIEQRILPIRIGMRTVGDPATEPYHPDIRKILKKFPGLHDLPIDQQIQLLRKENPSSS